MMYHYPHKTPLDSQWVLGSILITFAKSSGLVYLHFLPIDSDYAGQTPSRASPWCSRHTSQLKDPQHQHRLLGNRLAGGLLLCLQYFFVQKVPPPETSHWGKIKTQSITVQDATRHDDKAAFTFFR